MDARILGAVGAVVVIAGAGWLTKSGLEAAWNGMTPSATKPAPQIELEFAEDPPGPESVLAPAVAKAEPIGGATAAVAASASRSDRSGHLTGGILGKGGTIYWINGDAVHGSNGVTAESYGPVTYVQEPGGAIARYETFGSTTYGPNGIAAQRSGSTTFVTGPDGRIGLCETIGSVTNCS